MMNPPNTPLANRNRESNIELFRIIIMLLIVAHHLVVNSGLTALDGPIMAAPLSLRSQYLIILGAWGKTGINCFLMITGYFMCKSSITVKKFLKLFCEVKFYQIVIFIIFLAFGYETLSFGSVISLLLPFTEIADNFESCYLLFFLFIPFLNKLVNNMNEKQHLILLLLCFVTYTVIGTFHRTSFNYVSWFFVVYLCGAYIRMYPKDIYSRTSLLAVFTIACVILSAASVVVTTWYGVKTDRVEHYYHYFVTDSNSFLPTVTGICSFLFFRSLRVKRSRLINIIASSTFGVLCIHANSDAMRRWLWNDVLNVVGHYDSAYMPLFVLFSICAVFTVCVLIDQLRICFIEKPFLMWIDKLQGKRIKCC